MKRILFLLVLAYIGAGCKVKNSFSVQGVTSGETGKYIYINRIDVNTPVRIDSSKINKKGVFRFRVRAAEADFYQLGFSEVNFITLLAEPGEKIKLRFNGKNLYENYLVSGSSGSSKLQVLDVTLAETKRKLDSLRAIYTKSSKEPGFDKKGSSIEAEFSNLIREQRRKNIEFIIKNLNSLAAIKALYQNIDPEAYVLYDPHDLQYLKIVTDSLTHYYPNSKHVKALARDLARELNQMYADKIGEIARELPTTKLDPHLLNMEGKRISLSSLRGKYVLLAFWSAQSKECIEENLQLKKFYKLYNKKGFEIYQINIDESESVWKRAVRFDELPWISTREDDPGNPANAQIFNVKRLPANYLFDKEGTIIASDLHDKSLLLKLEQLFTK